MLLPVCLLSGHFRLLVKSWCSLYVSSQGTKPCGVNVVGEDRRTASEKCSSTEPAPILSQTADTSRPEANDFHFLYRYMPLSVTHRMKSHCGCMLKAHDVVSEKFDTKRVLVTITIWNHHGVGVTFPGAIPSFLFPSAFTRRTHS